MRYKIVNTGCYWHCELDEKYLKIVEEVFGKVEVREVYDNINSDNPTTEYYVDVTSIDQLQELSTKCKHELIIFTTSDDYMFIQEVNKYVLVSKNNLPDIWVIEIYDDYRE